MLPIASPGCGTLFVVYVANSARLVPFAFFFENNLWLRAMLNWPSQAIGAAWRAIPNSIAL